MRALQYVEIDIPSFVEASPPETETFRFAVDASYLPSSIQAIPSLLSVNLSPATISLGTNLGQRASVTCTFKDHRHIFNGEAFDAGTFWGKFRARYGLTLRGSPLRLVNGTLGQTLGQMDVRYFTIEETEGPDPQSGEFQIIAKDILKGADNDRAQAPDISNGYLSSPLGDGTESPLISTIVLSPTGIGAEYGTDFYAAIGGKEIVHINGRVGDILTIVGRAQLGTVASTHAANDRVQVVLYYLGQTAAVIISDLLRNYADVPSGYINMAEWNAEMAAYMPNVYTGIIGEPTGVTTLVSEVVEQAGLAVWWDDTIQKIKLRVIRPIPTDAALFTEDNILEGSLKSKEQPNSRLSEVWTYFGKRDPLKSAESADNYRASENTMDASAEDEYSGAVVKKIFARWIPAFGRTVAIRTNNIHLGRFRDPPRRYNFSTWRRGSDPIALGEGYRIMSWTLQNTAGAAVNTPIQVTRLNVMDDRIDVEAEEMLFTQYEDPGGMFERTVIIDSHVNNINLRSIHDSLYPALTGTESPPIVVTFIVNGGIIVGSTWSGAPAVHVGSWPPVGVELVLINNGRIQGAGGQGGTGFHTQHGGPGYPGGNAFYTRQAITVDNNADIWGGGGGGGGGGGAFNTSGTGGGGGGGGSGTIAGTGATGYQGGATNGNSGTSAAGGGGGGGVPGGSGGNPGLAGGAGTAGFYPGGAAGAAGTAVDGQSYITYDTTGNIQGATIN